MTCSCALSAIGALFVGYMAIRLLQFMKLNYFTSIDVKRRYGRAGEWAVVTGAGEGIGRAMAVDLSRRGMKLCLIGRTQSKLVELGKELKTEVMTIGFDFSTATEDDWKKLATSLSSINIAVLVNNVGTNYDYTNYFNEVPVETDLKLIKVNCESSVRLTKMVIPNMKEKRAGAILCLGSFSAVTPTAMLATYAGTKSFNVSFANALACELKEFGIDVLAVTPNMVVSKMTQGKSTRVPKESFLMVNADKMAHQTINKLGSTIQTAGHSNHAIIEAIIKMLPVGFVSSKILAAHKSVKKRAERVRDDAKK